MPIEDRKSVNGDAEVPHITVQVPAEYVEDFRAALLTEIRFEAEQIKDHVEHDQPGDIPPTLELLAADVRFLEQLLEAKGDFSVRTENYRDLEMAAHAFEAMCREIVGPRVQAATETTPIDAGSVPELRVMMERLSWAADRAAEYHKQAAEARELAGGRS